MPIHPASTMVPHNVSFKIEKLVVWCIIYKNISQKIVVNLRQVSLKRCTFLSKRSGIIWQNVLKVIGKKKLAANA